MLITGGVAVSPAVVPVLDMVVIAMITAAEAAAIVNTAIFQ